MTEPQKAVTSPVSTKDKTSMLDLDFGKDFLSSWKDDGLDFDFGSAAKGKKTAFKFDKMDMDFTLDADFGKLSSFKIDMSDLGITSPKKAGKPKERSKEISPGGNNRSKRDGFNFPFDFNDLNFESRPTKADGKSYKNQDAEGSSNLSENGGAGTQLAKDIDAMEDDISLKITASGGVATSNIDAQVGDAEDLVDRNEDDCLKSVTDDSCPPKPANLGEQFATRRETSPEKTISVNIQETEQESHQPEKITSPEFSDQETVQDLSGQSLVDNTSTQGTSSDLQEEVSTLDRKLGFSTNAEQNDNVSLTAGSESINRTSLHENLSSHSMMNSPRKNGETFKPMDDNDVLISNIDGDEPTNGDSHFEHTSTTCGSKKLLHGATPNERNQDSTSKLHQDTLNSGTTTAELVPAKETETDLSRSKFFKRPNEAESQLQQASLSRTKLISIGSKRISTMQHSPVDKKREHDAEKVQSRSKLTGISRPQPKGLTREKPDQTGNAESVKVLNSTSRECVNADGIETGSKSMVATKAHDQDVTKEELVLKGSDKNMTDRNALRSLVHPSGSNEQANKSASQNCLNSRLPLTSMTSIRNMKKMAVEQNRSSPITTDRRTPELSGQKVSRQTIGANLEPFNSSCLKDFTSTRNMKQNVELQGNLVSKRAYSVDTKKQTSPMPTLKRKFEESRADKLTLTPSKHVCASPNENRNTRSSSDRVVDKQVCHNEIVADDNNRYADIPQAVNITEIDTALAIENDANVEKAEACSKELEDICSMLKKKHEEAKEILVRAIVNNNNLLMLNHPIYQEKIRIIQKFAASIMPKELRT